MKKCDRCNINDDLIKRYCIFVYGKRQCYKKDVRPTLKTFKDGEYKSGNLKVLVRDDRVRYS